MKSQLHHYVISVCLCLSGAVFSQDSSRIYIDTSYRSSDHLKILDEENIDFFSNGFIRSTTNIFRFNLGAPDKFNLPFYLLLGTTADVISQDRFVNEEMTFDMLNVNGGLINAGYKLSLPFSENSKPTQLFLMHQLSAKSVNGIRYESGEKKSFLSYMTNVGVMLHAKAWNPNNDNERGHFWIMTTTSISKNPSDVIRQLLAESTSPYFIAIHIESGINLSDSINVKGGYYRFVNNQNVDGFSSGQFKLTGIYDL